MIALSFINKTPSAELIIKIKAVNIDSNLLLKYENKRQYEKLCQSSCPNYGLKWSCPPNTPEISSYLKEYPCSIVFLMWCDLNQLDYTRTDFMKVKAAHTILKARTNRLLEHFSIAFPGKVISCGGCTLCKPCKKKIQQPCRMPEKCRYSLESLGLNVEDISMDMFHHKLLWYKDKKAPEYTSVLSAFISKDEIPNDKVLEIINSSIG